MTMGKHDWNFLYVHMKLALNVLQVSHPVGWSSCSVQSEPDGDKGIVDAAWLRGHSCQLWPGMFASYFPARTVFQSSVIGCMHAWHGWIWSYYSYSREICQAWAATARCSHCQHRHGNPGTVFELGHGPGYSQAYFTGEDADGADRALAVWISKWESTEALSQVKGKSSYLWSRESYSA